MKIDTAKWNLSNTLSKRQIIGKINVRQEKGGLLVFIIHYSEFQNHLQNNKMIKTEASLLFPVLYLLKKKCL